ncbi:unnamed protein product [Somion occarium]|uniref:Uncharacterized protein n=1 Tax=Somion occarium TaxID=3059160 RepID=A0ABP1CV68_9APHY
MNHNQHPSIPIVESRAEATATQRTAHGRQAGAKCRHDLTAPGKAVRDAFYQECSLTAQSQALLAKMEEVAEKIRACEGCGFYTKRHLLKWMQAKKKGDSQVLWSTPMLHSTMETNVVQAAGTDSTAVSEYDSPKGSLDAFAEEEGLEGVKDARTVGTRPCLPPSPSPPALSCCNFGARITSHYNQMLIFSVTSNEEEEEAAEPPSFRLRPVHTW